jgi:hypothetical protein
MNRLRLTRRAWLLLALLLPLPALAWNSAGHRLVACIAWDLLDLPQRAALARLLQRHPDYARWQQRASDHHPASAEDRATFIEASTWPDEIRKDGRFYSAGRDFPTTTLPGFPDMERRSDWHYVAWPLTDTPHGEAVAGRIDQALVELPAMLGAQDDASRSYALPWLIHLVGDAHQPLHTTWKIDAQGKPDRLVRPAPPPDDAARLLGRPARPRRAARRTTRRRLPDAGRRLPAPAAIDAGAVVRGELADRASGWLSARRRERSDDQRRVQRKRQGDRQAARRPSRLPPRRPAARVAREMNVSPRRARRTRRKPRPPVVFN